MPFPLGDWIDAHEDCRYNLGQSGMRGAIPGPVPTAAEVRRADESELRRLLARDLGVDRTRVFLTTGASAANALTVLYLGRNRRSASRPTCRVWFPEYPPLFDMARQVGFRLTAEPGRTDLAVVSLPRNPEGDLWETGRFLEWASGARSVLVDETFREFAGARSLVQTERPGLWTTGTFTKFFAGDHLRVGFLVAPEESARDFARFHGIAVNHLSPYSVAGASRALHDRERIRRQVRRILDRNVAALRSALPRCLPPRGPVAFDRLGADDAGDRLADRALRASVLVCPGSFFGDPSGVRLCLTRRTFPDDLTAYLRVRSGVFRGGAANRGKVSATGRAARRRPAGTVRATAAPS
jgi:histidinol-phosphate/aromatic aminotransferase/cobyric acid decarboxylase-like protein